MTRQRILWTALPQPVAGLPPSERLRISVLVSPRLEPTGGAANQRISRFPDWERWPKVVADIRFRIEVAGGLALDAQPVGPPPRLDLWQALVKPDTWVRPYAPSDLHLRPIYSYPVRHVLNFMKGVYQKVGVANPTDLPKTDALLQPDLLGPINAWTASGLFAGRILSTNPETELLTQIRRHLGEAKALPPAGQNPLLDFGQMRLFHLREGGGTGAGAGGGPAPKVPEFDFHDLVAALADYPALMRQLGLVIDLEIPASKLPPLSTIRVLPRWKPALQETFQAAPRVAYSLDNNGFFPVPGQSPLVEEGMLRLENREFFTAFQVDTDGAALKLLDLTHNLHRSSLRSPLRSTNTPTQTSLPALRSAGIAVAQTGLAFQLAQDFAETNRLEEALAAAEGTEITGNRMILYADTITQGYRIDVWDGTTSNWYPLCRRVGTYSLPETTIGLRLEDEGWISLAATSPTAAPGTSLRLHEAFIRWTGWSLVAPRPGRAIDPAEQVQTPENRPATPFKLETHFVPVPGTLPRLRFGRDYRLRARAVDLAGNSLPLGDRSAKDFAHATAEITYRRFEPVESPTLLPRTAMGPGESVERVVIRSRNRTQPAAGESERHLLPPRVAQEMAEAHGLFDKPIGLNKAAYALITARDQPLPEKDFYPEAQVAIHYLPDPIARAAALKGLPGLPADESLAVPFDGTWPERSSFRLRVVGGDGPPQLGGGVLTLFLPQAEVARVRISSKMDPDDLKLMALWGWLQESASSSQLATLERHCLQGCHWMLTPHREVVLVHAVEQPLEAPVLTNPSAVRKLGEAAASLRGSLRLHGKSTGKVDLLATWKEPVDRLDQPRWEWVNLEGPAFDLPIQPDDVIVTLGPSHPLGEKRLRHRFSDTRHRKVTYQPVATSRFTEYFPAGAPERFTLDGPTVAVSVPNSARPAAPKVLYVMPTFRWERQESATGRESRRRGGGLRVYLERPWFSSGEGEQLAVILWPGPMAASGGTLTAGSPGPGTSSQGSDDASTRRLAAIDPTLPVSPIKPLPTVPIPISPIILRQLAAAAQPYVTAWGQDPIWATTSPREQPLAEHFALAAGSARSGLSLAEVPGAQVIAVPHQVEYDQERQLWYCDIEIDAGPTYFPFVRLALARYQPNSIADAHLSPVVLADYAQLTPDRSVSLTFDAADPHLLHVSTAGTTAANTKAPGGLNQWVVSLESRGNATEGAFGWVPVPGSEVELVRETDGLRILVLAPRWSGAIRLPAPRGSQPFRLVIREYEWLEADADPKGSAQRSTPQRRLVFAETLAV